MRRRGKNTLKGLGLATLGATMTLSASDSGAIGGIEARTGEPQGYAYTLLLSGNGNWIGPKLDGQPDLTIFDAIEAAQPEFARVTTHSGPRGVATPVPIPSSQEITDRLIGLRDMGIHLGVSLNAFWVHGTKRKMHKSVGKVLSEACTIRTATEGLYDWIFLDFALSRTTSELHKLVEGLKSGDRCDGLGWERVMTNSTNWKNADSARLPRGAWSHGSRIALMNNGAGDAHNKWRTRARLAAEGKYPAIGPSDIAFVDHAHDVSRDSMPVLKLEIPHQTSNFASLQGGIQRELISRWAAAGRKHGFELMFPLFVHKRSTPFAYDSRKEKTFALQVRLLRESKR